MEPISLKDYRNNLSASFNRADNGEIVLIRRNNHIYQLIRTETETMLSPELQERIASVRNAHVAGETVICSTEEELDNLLNSL